MGCSKCRERKRYPTYGEMAQNLTMSFANVIKHALKTGQIRASDEVVQQRIQRCKSCVFIMSEKRCKICGCFVALKAGLEAEKCPKGYW